jgi:hypothetical protein
MRATNLQPPRKNGSAQANSGEKSAAPGRKAPGRRSSAKPKPADSPGVEAIASPQELAGFARATIRPVDAEMWPVQPVVWLQPEWKPALPASSDLRIERHHKIPVPGFLNVAPGRSCSAGGLAAGSSIPSPALPPNVRPTPPESCLTLLGWDPRTVVPSGSAGAHDRSSSYRSSSHTNSAARFPTESKE